MSRIAALYYIRMDIITITIIDIQDYARGLPFGEVEFNVENRGAKGRNRIDT